MPLCSLEPRDACQCPAPCLSPPLMGSWARITVVCCPASEAWRRALGPGGHGLPVPACGFLGSPTRSASCRPSAPLLARIRLGQQLRHQEQRLHATIFATSTKAPPMPLKREIAQGVLGSESLIITLDDLKKIIIDIKVPENYVSVLKSGLKAEVTSSAYEKIFKGKIETISSRIDPSTRSILSRIVVDNSNFEIIPGQLMTVKIIYDEIQQIGVPESAVTIQGDTAFVYTVTDDAAKKQNIKIGKRNFGKVSAISGLNEGDIVIVEGDSKVRDKAKVKIVTPAK